jgi:GrpB-like predicted nucleotidyltransferase (UPF0157 family)
MKIIIEEYNSTWKLLFQQEQLILSKALLGIESTIEHIGSTSVEGLGAKPVIDILIGLKDFAQANDQVNKLTDLGYQYISVYEDVMPYRRFFIKECNGIRTHHIHMVETDSEFWIRHIAFRDYLRKNPEELMNYYLLKKELAQKEWKDGNEYANAKTEFIRRIERKALK